MTTKPAKHSFISQRQPMEFQEISMTEIEAPSVNLGKNIRLQDTEQNNKINMTSIKQNFNIFEDNN